MDEVRQFCVRMLGDGSAARDAEHQALADGGAERLARLKAAVAACRGREGEHPAAPEEASLSEAVAAELAAASSRLPDPQREALALRELLRLDYGELAEVAGQDPDAVAVLLARSRIALRVELRGPGEPQPDCPERERALRTLALRQDGQPVSKADDDWLVEHLGHCRGCGQAHAAMLEAVACYRAWSPEATGAARREPRASAGAGTSP